MYYRRALVVVHVEGRKMSDRLEPLFVRAMREAGFTPHRVGPAPPNGASAAAGRRHSRPARASGKAKHNGKAR